MPHRFAKLVAAGLLAATAVVAVAQEQLSSAYNAILRGDYETGRAVIERLKGDQARTAKVLQAENWLSSFQKLLDERDKLRQETFTWNVEHAREALDSGRVYLALSFAAQAVPYASEKSVYAREPWIAELREKVLARAADYDQKEDWGHALAHYALLERIFENDDELAKLREEVGLHARAEALYGDAKDLEERIDGVTKSMLTNVVTRVRDNYYEDPDFKKMATGALRSLKVLCTTPKLYKTFDGIANPHFRDYFLKKLQDFQRDVEREQKFSARDLLRLFNDVYSESQVSVQVPQEVLVIEFTEGALLQLDDFTSMIWPADLKDFMKMMMGEFTGVGIQLGIDEYTNRLKVVTPLENSPALEAGVQPGDLIVKVDERETKGWSTTDAVREITGPAGSTVTLTLFRPGVGNLEVPLERREIHLKTVRGVRRQGSGTSETWDYMLDKDQGIAYVLLTGFTQDSHIELMQALEEAQKQGMRGLVLDLRHNPGGLLDVAVETVNMFVKRGTVVSTRGRDGIERQRMEVDGRAEFADLPMVVLVNDSSASASEIVAGALKDDDRAMVLGERTFGKGSVQRVLPLDSAWGGDARLKLTTALYYLPSGRSPHREKDSKTWGVEPNLVLNMMPKEVIQTLEQRHKVYIINNAGEPDLDGKSEALTKALDALKDDKFGKDEDGEDDGEDALLLTADEITLLQSDPYKAPDVDPQLETALLQLRIKLAGNLPWPRAVTARLDEPRQ